MAVKQPDASAEPRAKIGAFKQMHERGSYLIDKFGAD